MITSASSLQKKKGVVQLEKDHSLTYECLDQCVKWRLTIDVNGQTVTIPCTNKALQTTHNPNDLPNLESDLIDKLLERETCLSCSNEEVVHLNRAACSNTHNSSNHSNSEYKRNKKVQKA